MTRGRGRLLSLTVGTIGLVGCGVLILLLTYRHNLRVDLSPQRSYALSSAAKKLLAELPRDVRDRLRAAAKTRYAAAQGSALADRQETKRITYDFVDLNRSPRWRALRRRPLQGDHRGERRPTARRLESDGGVALGALSRVPRDRERMVYFLTGHGERSPDDSDRKAGLSVAKNTLEDDQFVVRTLPLMQSGPYPSTQRSS
jgi:hypothetical protein